MLKFVNHNFKEEGFGAQKKNRGEPFDHPSVPMKMRHLPLDKLV
jgi:hypothetical protein